MFVGTVLDAVAHGFGQETRTAHGKRVDENARPLVEHEEDVEDLLVGSPERNGAVVFEKDDFWRGTVVFDVGLEGTAELAGQFQSRIDVGDNRHLATANDNRIGEDVLQERLCAVVSRKNREHRLGMAVTNPFGTAL